MAKRILLVDDEETLRLALHEALTDDGYEVENSGDSVKALELAKSRSYDLVISDLKMPNMGGLQLVAELKKLHPDIKPIVMTAYGSIETVIEAMHIGVVDFLTKPFKIEQIRGVIRRVLNTAPPPTNNNEKNNAGLKVEYKHAAQLADAFYIAQGEANATDQIFYDFVKTETGRVFLFGSVPGETEAKNLDMVIKTVFRQASKAIKSSAVMLREINQHLCNNINDRFPVTLFCAVLDEQKEALCYSIQGEGLTCVQSLSGNREMVMLKSSPHHLNVFPAIRIMEDSVSFTSDSKIVVIGNNSLSKGINKGAIAVDTLKNILSDAVAPSCADMAKRIKLQVEGLHDLGIVEKGAVVMVSNLRFKDEAPSDFFTTIPIPLVNYGETVKLFDEKLSLMVEDDSLKHEIITSTNEAVVNAASFAYQPDEKGQISVKMCLLGDEIIVEVCDQGCGFDAQRCMAPDAVLDNDLSRKNGRGIFMIKQLMDRVAIQSYPNTGTTVYMAKRITGNEN
jgi:CheY-like chemotaxis protein/anti-sigma regulatory factor (Ser/Thr protein kinase)